MEVAGRRQLVAYPGGLTLGFELMDLNKLWTNKVKFTLSKNDARLPLKLRFSQTLKFPEARQVH